MIATYLIAVVAVFALFAGWVLVQHAARLFAARHPELGPAREEGGGCGAACTCAMSGHCRRELESTPRTEQALGLQEEHP